MQLFACYYLLLSAYLLGVVDTVAPEKASTASTSAAMLGKDNYSHRLEHDFTSRSENVPTVHQENDNLEAHNVDKVITSTHRIASPQGKDARGRKGSMDARRHHRRTTKKTSTLASMLPSSRVRLLQQQHFTLPPNNNNNGSNNFHDGFPARTINSTDDITDDTLPSNTTNVTTPTYPPGEAPSYSPGHRPSLPHRHSAEGSIRAGSNMNWLVLEAFFLATSMLLV